MDNITMTARPRKWESPMLKELINRLGDLPKLMGKVGRAVTTEIKMNLSGRILHKRTGNLWASWDWQLKAISQGWRLTIGSENIPYARIHEFGGMTGKGHKTRIKASCYVSKAVDAKKDIVTKWARDFVVLGRFQ